MKLRWFVVHYGNGVKTQPVLQYWDEDAKKWENVPYFECNIYDEEKCLYDENLYFN